MDTRVYSIYTLYTVYTLFTMCTETAKFSKSTRVFSERYTQVGDVAQVEALKLNPHLMPGE